LKVRHNHCKTDTITGKKMQNHHQRAVAGSSRRLADHAAAVETGVLLALSGNAHKDFSRLLHELAPISQSTFASYADLNPSVAVKPDDAHTHERAPVGPQTVVTAVVVSTASSTASSASGLVVTPKPKPT
jgi:hypothetical protein